ncbi:MAG: permease prefix domain 2-containing transporter, partial [Cyclobacteriaceae bacterium]
MRTNSSYDPPRWANRLLEFLCREESLEEIQGDLFESFHWRAENKGAAYAKRQFIKETLLSIRMSNLKQFQFMDQFITLFRSHCKSGWRYLWKTRTYSSINIIGLSIGIVFSWFAYIYMKDQFSYNQHFRNVKDLHRLSIQANMFDNVINFPGCSHVATEKIREQIPEVEGMARFTDDQALIKLGKTTLDEQYLMAEKTLLDYLNLNFIEGSPGDFKSPDQVVISESMAYKLNIRGESADHYLEVLDSATFSSYRIVGVYEDIPLNSSINTDIILPYSHFIGNSDEAGSKSSFSISTILKLNNEADPELVAEKINLLINTKDSPATYMALLQSIEGLHLSDNYFAAKGFLPGGNSRLIWMIVIAGILCLSISIINYANFSISLYMTRAREVAVRKIMGSAGSGVFNQLMTESFLTVILSALVALGLFVLIAPLFSNLVEKQFTIIDLFSIEFIPGVFIILLGIA